MNRNIFKCPFPRKTCDYVFYSIRVRILVMTDFPFIWWRIVNLKFELCIKLIDDDNLNVARHGSLSPLLDLVENRIISQ